MPRGYPDYGIDEEFGKLLMPTDIAELAVRLGSIVGYDRRGTVVAIDDFENPILKWGVGFDPGGSVILDSASVKSGSQAVKLTVINNALANTQMQNYYNALKSHRQGMEAAFSYLDNNLYLQYTLQVMYDVGYKQARVRVDPMLLDLYVQTAPAIYAKVADIKTLYNANHSYYRMKLVADFDTDQYVRLLFADQEYNISAHTILDAGSAGTPVRGVATINGQPRVATGGAFYIDDFIMTQDEP